MNIDLSEVDGLAEALLKAPDQARTVAEEEVTEAGKRVQSNAKAAAPRDRPWLANNIRRRTWKQADGIHSDVFVGPDPEGRPVAVVVEYGTTKMAPQPFLTPTADVEGEVMLQKILRRVGVFE